MNYLLVIAIVVVVFAILLACSPAFKQSYASEIASRRVVRASQHQAIELLRMASEMKSGRDLGLFYARLNELVGARVFGDRISMQQVERARECPGELPAIVGELTKIARGR